MQIIFVRHGQDPEGYLGGWSRHDLTPEGIEQAKAVAQYLKQADFQFTKLLSSDLPRALSTAEIIAGELELDVIHEPALREMNNGRLAGLPIAEAAEQYPGLYFNTLDMDQHYPGGESPREFYERVRAWFEGFPKSGGNVLIVTHGGVLNIIYHIVKGESWSNKKRPYPAGNCSVHVLDVEKMEFVVENLTDHIRG